MARLEQMDAVVLGERLRSARTNRGLTQEDAARSLGVARTTMVAIERGERRVKPDELVKLSDLYGVSANSLLRAGAAHVDLAAQFRRSEGALEHGSSTAVKILHDLASAYVDVERRLGTPLRGNYPAERPIAKQGYAQQAEDMALELRQQLGLGLGPIPDVPAVLEAELGLRVFLRPIDSRVSEVFAYHAELGACFLLNANHPRERRSWSLAHGVGHLLTTRSTADVCLVSGAEGRVAERFADLFAAAFVLPAAAVRRRHADVVGASEGRFSPRHVIHLAHLFHVSREAMARRLEQLELIKKGSTELMKEHGAFSEDTARQVLGTEALKLEARRPSRFLLLCAEAYNRELISEGQLAEMLGLSRIEARAAVDALDGGDLMERDV